MEVETLGEVLRWIIVVISVGMGAMFVGLVGLAFYLGYKMYQMTKSTVKYDVKHEQTDKLGR